MALVVETDFPGGNACDVSVEDAGRMPVIRFAADPHGGPECLWFYFRVRRTGGRAGARRVKLVFRHFETILGGNDPGAIRPVVRPKGGDWDRLEPGRAEALPDGRVEVVWEVEMNAASWEVAFCYPYGKPELEALLRETDGVWQADAVGVSQAGRPLVRLSNAPGAPGSDRPGVYVTARQHSGEVPGSWVLDGFLRYLGSPGDRAPLVWAVPLANVDGVEAGDYGKDNFPYDLNRAWGRPPMRHETLVIQRDMQRWKARCRPVLCLDFHAPGGCEREGMYFFLPHPDLCPEPHREARQWARALSGALTGAYAAENFGRVPGYASRWETPTFTSYCCTVLGVCAMTLEVPYAAAGETLLTRERYREAGERLAACVVQHLKG